MLSIEVPYFLTNKEWYTVDEEETDGRGYKLTDKAPEEARESYEAFYATETDRNGWESK